MGGSYSHYLFRLPPGQFSQSALIAIPVPPPATVFPYFIRQLTQDANGHIWFDDLRGGRLFKIPLAGPYVAASLTAYGLPKGPPGTPGITPSGQGIAVGNDRLLYVLDYLNGVVDQVSPASGLTERQLVLPQQETFGPNDSAYPRFIAKDGSGKLYFTYIGDTTYKPPVAPGIDELVPPSTAIKSVPIFEPPSGSQPDSIGANGANLYYADLYGALGYIDTATNQTRLFPTFSVAQSLSSDYYETPDGIAAMPDGTAWFTCDNYKVLVPECLGHTVYLTGWSLFPGPTFTLLTGSGNAQGVGIMESPKVNSGPFKAVSDKTAICSIGGLSDHNFYVTGLKPGSCVVTVTDIAHHAATLQIVVQSAPPQVRPRRRRVAF
jgi:streptogramin lyase